MPVHVKLSSSNRIEVNIANRDDSPSRRREGPRYDYLTREEALTLIQDLAEAIKKMGG